jgi:hypothetical protein
MRFIALLFIFFVFKTVFLKTEIFILYHQNSESLEEVTDFESCSDWPPFLSVDSDFFSFEKEQFIYHFFKYVTFHPFGETSHFLFLYKDHSLGSRAPPLS